MYPVLFRFPESIPLIGGVALNSFGVMLAMSFLVGARMVQKHLDREGYDGEKGWDVAFIGLIGGLIGAKLYWVFSQPARLAADPLGTLFSGTGLTWYGGFGLGLVAFWWAMRRAKLPIPVGLDALGLGLPLAIAVGRVGCFLAGDDYGRPTGSALGVRFPEGFPPTTVEVLQSRFGVTVDPDLVERFGNVIPVHPTQLYEVAISLLVFAVIATRKSGQQAGWLFALWLTLYGVQRFVVEGLRLNARVFLGLTVAQLISVALFGAGLYYLSRLRTRSAATS
ncbi:MAG: prolipoprotein diacylglyceryl transferase [Longimicrobiales bacterium]